MKQVKVENFPQLDYATNEALNTLGSNIVFSGENIRRILVTSCREHEGKSFVAMGIMNTLASMGYSVALVDADLRRSVIASKYGIRFPADGMGLSHYLTRRIALEDVAYETDIPGAYMIPVGRDVVNSMQLLSSLRFEEMLNQLTEKVDYVIVDTPPVGAIVDAAVAAKSCDGAIIVVASNMATKRELVSAKHQIEKSGCPVIGAVLNKVEMTRSGSKYYHRYYGAYASKGYYRRDSEGEGRGKKKGARA